MTMLETSVPAIKVTPRMPPARRKVTYTVFTKAWRTALPELAVHIRDMGFDGIELPVRPGFQVTPDSVASGLKEAVGVMADHGLTIGSIAGPIDERTIAACGASGIRVIRICPEMREGENYLAYVKRIRSDLDAALPVLEAYGVTIGFQNHAGRWVCNAMGLRHVLQGYDPRHVAAVLDFAHCGLDGEAPEMALDIVEDRLCMVNLKNAVWRQATGPDAEYAKWEWYFTSGRHGFTVWNDVVRELCQRRYEGVVCLTAEYTQEEAVDRLAREDLAFVKSLFEKYGGHEEVVKNPAQARYRSHERA